VQKGKVRKTEPSFKGFPFLQFILLLFKLCRRLGGCCSERIGELWPTAACSGSIAMVCASNGLIFMLGQNFSVEKPRQPTPFEIHITNGQDDVSFKEEDTALVFR
jgi:hypothetical protein